MSKPSVYLRVRLLQIRAVAKFLELLGLSRRGAALIVGLRGNSFFGPILGFLVGYRRDYPSFEQAAASARRFIPSGHEHPDDVAFHSSIADTIRESDFPVLFHLAPQVSRFSKVFDLGGNVGNLFYAYQKELNFPADLAWHVFDLPEKKPAGQALARQRNESRIRFSDSLADASGCDLFIASGSLHYFEQPLDQMLLSLDQLPPHVIVNRIPCFREDNPPTDLSRSFVDDLITVQDNKTYLVPCIVHNSDKLIASMRGIGYSLRASWPIHERKLCVPLSPDRSSEHYSGFYFQRLDSRP